MAPQCRYWANRCKSNYCQKCCESIHLGVVWTWHARPDGIVYKFQHGDVHSALPTHYGGADMKAEKSEITDPLPPVVGQIEDVTPDGKTLLPVKDNSYFSPRGATSGFPVQYDK